eukprot:TRINITY_DN17914_c0_g1_i1.p1 TRINITY_DN17914_c0_g1~~TRINITY_DN17914_c0_g1_i1.p1  ORF type:complete len:212 (+),score=49.38 TRINITY_DN17914_c0_g1_i1:33-668(+)
MGKEQSKHAIDRRDRVAAVETLRSESNFSPAQIEALYNRFTKLSSSREDDGVISKDEFLDALGIKNSIIVDRIFHLFDSDGTGGIDFREFVIGLSILSCKADYNTRLHCMPARYNKTPFPVCFRLYDIDNNGYISKEELSQICDACLKQNDLIIPAQHLAALVDATFSLADTDGDGLISQTEFGSYVQRHPQVMEQFHINSQALQELEQVK